MSMSFKIRLDPAIALYESVSNGFLRDFKRGRKEHARSVLVTVPWIRKDLMIEAKQSNTESGAFRRASLV